MFLFIAISLGFLGSFHCIGMCGPIALVIPLKDRSFFSLFSGSLVYNLGRMTTYALLGLLFGLLGQGFVFAGWQNILSISLGIIILLFLFFPMRKILPFKSRFISNIISNLKSQISNLFAKHSYPGLLFIGLLNGLLPCGLVYLGIAGSMATGNALKGALFMAAFGLGTFPVMIFISLARNLISIKFRQSIRKAIPVFVGIMAVMLILRGMNLGIPYLSPSVEITESGCQHQCCHK
jgi:uncharacterized protein